MADRVRFNLDRLAPFFRQLGDSELFSKDEVSSIVKKVTDFEYTIIRSDLTPQHYKDYINYELQLDRLKELRYNRIKKETNGQVPKKQQDLIRTISTSFIQQTNYIYERACRRFQNDISLWEGHLAYLKEKESYSFLDVALGKALALHPHNIRFWIIAATHELEAKQNIHAARIIIQRGLRTNFKSNELWQQYFQLELFNIVRTRERQRLLGITKPHAYVEEKEEEMIELELPLFVVIKHACNSLCLNELKEEYRGYDEEMNEEEEKLFEEKLVKYNGTNTKVIFDMHNLLLPYYNNDFLSKKIFELIKNELDIRFSHRFDYSQHLIQFTTRYYLNNSFETLKLTESEEKDKDNEKKIINTKYINTKEVSSLISSGKYHEVELKNITNTFYSTFYHVKKLIFEDLGKSFSTEEENTSENSKKVGPYISCKAEIYSRLISYAIDFLSKVFISTLLNFIRAKENNEEQKLKKSKSNDSDDEEETEDEEDEEEEFVTIDNIIENVIEDTTFDFTEISVIQDYFQSIVEPVSATVTPKKRKNESNAPVNSTHILQDLFQYYNELLKKLNELIPAVFNYHKTFSNSFVLAPLAIYEKILSTYSLTNFIEALNLLPSFEENSSLTYVTNSLLNASRFDVVYNKIINELNHQTKLFNNISFPSEILAVNFPLNAGDFLKYLDHAVLILSIYYEKNFFSTNLNKKTEKNLIENLITSSTLVVRSSVGSSFLQSFLLRLLHNNSDDSNTSLINEKQLDEKVKEDFEEKNEDEITFYNKNLTPITLKLKKLSSSNTQFYFQYICHQIITDIRLVTNEIRLSWVEFYIDSLISIYNKLLREVKDEDNEKNLIKLYNNYLLLKISFTFLYDLRIKNSLLFTNISLISTFNSMIDLVEEIFLIKFKIESELIGNDSKLVFKKNNKDNETSFLFFTELKKFYQYLLEKSLVELETVNVKEEKFYNKLITFYRKSGQHDQASHLQYKKRRF